MRDADNRTNEWAGTAMKLGPLALAQARALAFGVSVFFVAFVVVIPVFFVLGWGLHVIWPTILSFIVSVAIACAFGRWNHRESLTQYRAGCCPACGYNLTANISGRCPECGTPTGQDRVE